MEPTEDLIAEIENARAKLIADVVAHAGHPEGANVDTGSLQGRLCAAMKLADDAPAYLYALALSMIERLGDTFDAGDPETPGATERALGALGSLIVQGSRLAALWGLDIGPVLELARAFQRRQEVQPLRAPTVLARALLTRGDRVTCQRAIGEGIALAVAKGLDDVEVIHGIDLDPGRLFEIVGAEELARAAADDETRRQFTGWEDQWMEFFRRHGVDTDKLEPGTGTVPFQAGEVPPATDVPVPGPDAVTIIPLAPLSTKCRRCKVDIVPIRGSSALCGPCADASREAWTKAAGERRPDEPADTPRTREALAMLHAGADGLAAAEAHEGRADFALDPPTRPGISFDPEAHVNHERICPIDAGLLSYSNGTGWRCSNERCEFKATDEEMAAMLGRPTRPIDP